MRSLCFVVLITGLLLANADTSNTDNAAFEACARALAGICQSSCVAGKSPSANSFASVLLRCHVMVFNSSTASIATPSLRVLLPNSLAPWLRPKLARFSALYGIPLSLHEQPPAQILHLAQLTAASLGGLPLPPTTPEFTTPASPGSRTTALPTSTATAWTPTPAMGMTAANALDVLAASAAAPGPFLATWTAETAPTTSPPPSIPYDSPESGVASYDVWLHPGAVTQLLADVGELADMSYLVEIVDQGLAWQDIPHQLRLQLGTYNGTTVGVPYDSTTLLTLYRRDALAALGLQVPATWTELITFLDTYRKAREAAEGRMQGRRVLFSNVTTSASDGGGLGATDLPVYPLCLPLGEGCSRVSYLQAIWSSLVQTHGSAQGGVHFDPTTLQPLLDIPAALEATRTLAALLAAAAPPEEGEGCSHGAVGFTRGSCALVLAGFVPQMALFMSPMVHAGTGASGTGTSDSAAKKWLVPQGFVGVAPLPGSERVWIPQPVKTPADATDSGGGGEGQDGQRQGYVQVACNETTCPYAVRVGAAGEVEHGGSAAGQASRLVNVAPLLLESALVGGVSRRSPVFLQLLSFQLLAYVASPDRYQSISTTANDSLAQAVSETQTVNANTSGDIADTGGFSDGGSAKEESGGGGEGTSPPPQQAAGIVAPSPVMSVTPVRLPYIQPEYADSGEHLDVWARAGYDRDLVAAAMPALADAAHHPNLALGLRMAGAAYYNDLLDSLIRGLQSGAIASSFGATYLHPSPPLSPPPAPAPAPGPAPGPGPPPAPVPKDALAGDADGGAWSRLLFDAANGEPLSLEEVLTALQVAATAYYHPEVFKSRYLASLHRPATIPVSWQGIPEGAIPPLPSSPRTAITATTAAAVSAAVGCGLLAAAARVLVAAVAGGRRGRTLRSLAVAVAARVRRRLLRAYPSSLGLRPRLPRLAYDISVSRHAQVTAPQAGSETAILVTDIQSSTRLWEELAADVMSAAVQLHHACIRRLVVEHAGYESATEGDSFILAFRSVKQAVAFALDLQVQLLVLPWPQELLKDEICMPLYTDLPDGFPVTNQNHNHHLSSAQHPPDDECASLASPTAVSPTAAATAAGASGGSGSGAISSIGPMPYELYMPVSSPDGPDTVAAAGSFRPSDMPLLRLSRMGRRRDWGNPTQTALSSPPAAGAIGTLRSFKHNLPGDSRGRHVDETRLSRVYSPRRSRRILEVEGSDDGGIRGTQQRGWLRLRTIVTAAGVRLCDRVRRRWFRRAEVVEAPVSMRRRCDRLSIDWYGFPRSCVQTETLGMVVANTPNGAAGVQCDDDVYDRPTSCLHPPLHHMLDMPTADSQQSRGSVVSADGKQQNSSDSDGDGSDDVFSACCTAAAAALAAPAPSPGSTTAAARTLAAAVSAASARCEAQAASPSAAMQTQRSHSYSPPRRRSRCSLRAPSRSTNPSSMAPPPPLPTSPSYLCPSIATAPAAMSSAGGSAVGDFLDGGLLPPPPRGVTLGQLLGSLNRPSFQAHEAEGRTRRLLMFRGLRVRVGIHTGVSRSTAELQYNAASARMVYGGPCVAACKVVADLAHGGQVFLSDAARRQLDEGVHGHNGGRPWGTLLLHIGTFVTLPPSATTLASSATALPTTTLQGTRSEAALDALQRRRTPLAPLPLPRAGSQGAIQQVFKTPTVITSATANISAVAESPAVSAPGHAVYPSPSPPPALVVPAIDSPFATANRPRCSFNLPPTEIQLALKNSSSSSPTELGLPNTQANGGGAAIWRRPPSAPPAPAPSTTNCTSGPPASPPPPLSVYWLTSPALAQRMALVPPPRLPANVLPHNYVYDAPVGRVSYAVVQVPAASTLMAWDQRAASAALRVLADTAAAVLHRVPGGGGYMTSPTPGELCVAFSSSLAAVRWAEGLRLELLEAPWSKALLQHELCEPLYITDSNSDSNSGSISSSDLSAGPDLLIASPASAMSAVGGGAATSKPGAPASSAGGSASGGVRASDGGSGGGCSRRCTGALGSCSSDNPTLLSWRDRLGSGFRTAASSSHQFKFSGTQASNQYQHPQHHHHHHHHQHHHHQNHHHHHQHHQNHIRPPQNLSKSLLLFGRNISSRLNLALPSPASGGLTAWISSRLNPGLQASGFGFGGSGGGGGGSSPLRSRLTAGSSPPGFAAAAAMTARAAALYDNDVNGLIDSSGGGGAASSGCSSAFPHVPSRLGLMHRVGQVSNASPLVRRRSIGTHCATAPISAASASASATVTKLEATAAAAGMGMSSSCAVQPSSTQIPRRTYGEPLPYKTSVAPASAIVVEVAGWTERADGCKTKGSSPHGSLRVGSPGVAIARHQLVRRESSLEVLPRVKADALAATAGFVQLPLFEVSADVVNDDDGDDGNAAEDSSGASPESVVLVPDGDSTESPHTTGDNTHDHPFSTTVNTAASTSVSNASPAHPPPRHQHSKALSTAHPMMNCALELELCNGGVAGGVSCRQVSQLAGFLSCVARDCTTPQDSPPCWSRGLGRDGTSERANDEGAIAAGTVASTMAAAVNADVAVSVSVANDNGNDQDTTGGGGSGGDGVRGSGSSGVAYRLVEDESVMEVQGLDDILPQRLAPRGLPCEINHGGGGGGGDFGDGSGCGGGVRGIGGGDNGRASAGSGHCRSRRLLLRGLRVRIGIATGTASWSIADHTHDVSYNGRPVRQARRLAASYAASSHVLCCSVTCQEALATQASYDKAYGSVTSAGRSPSPPQDSSSAGEGDVRPRASGAGAVFDDGWKVTFTPLRLASGLQAMSRKSTVFVCSLYRASLGDASPANTPRSNATLLPPTTPATPPTAKPRPATVTFRWHHDTSLGPPPTSFTCHPLPRPSLRPATTGGLWPHPHLNSQPLPFGSPWTSSPMPHAGNLAPSAAPGQAGQPLMLGSGPPAHVSASSQPIIRPHARPHIHPSHMHSPPLHQPPPPQQQQRPQRQFPCAHDIPSSTAASAVAARSPQYEVSCRVTQQAPTLDNSWPSQAATAAVREGELRRLRTTLLKMGSVGSGHARRGSRAAGGAGLWAPPEVVAEEAEQHVQQEPADSRQIPQNIQGRREPYGGMLAGVGLFDSR